MKRVTVVLEAGDIGAAIACAVAKQCGLENPGYMHRRDGGVQVNAYADDEDKSARNKWVHLLRSAGLTVRPAPWEKRG